MQTEALRATEVQPVPDPTVPCRAPPRLRPRAEVRVPLTLTVRPRARLYRLPDGRLLWCLRLPEDGVVRTRCVDSARLLRYARSSGLAELEADLVEALARRRGAR